MAKETLLKGKASDKGETIPKETRHLLEYRACRYYLFIIIAIVFIVFTACVPLIKKPVNPGVSQPNPTKKIEQKNIIVPSMLAEWTIGNTEDMAWSPDSEMFAVKYWIRNDQSNNYIQAFDVTSLQKKWIAKNSLGLNLLFTSDKKSIIETNNFAPVLYWRSLENGDVIRQVKAEGCPGGGQNVIAKPDENAIFVANWNDLIGLNTHYRVSIFEWKLKSGECNDLLEYQGGFDIFDLNTRGSLLAFGGEGRDDSVVIWDTKKKAEICRIDQVDFGRFVPGQDILAVSREQKIVFIDAPTCQYQRELPITTIGTNLAFSQDGRFMATAEKHSINIHDIKTGERLAQISLPNDAGVSSSKLFPGGIKFSPNGHYLLLAFYVGIDVDHIQLWRLSPTN